LRIPNGALTSFGGIVSKGFGSDTFTTHLFQIPISAFGLVFVLSSAYLARRFKCSRCTVITVLQLIALAGCAMVYALPSSDK
jgi:hypothetical protein